LHAPSDGLLVKGRVGTRSISTPFPPVDGILASLSQDYTPALNSPVPIYAGLGGERNCESIRCLAQERNKMSLTSRLEPGPLNLETNALTMKPPRFQLFSIFGLLKHITPTGYCGISRSILFLSNKVSKSCSYTRLECSRLNMPKAKAWFSGVSANP